MEEDLTAVFDHPPGYDDGLEDAVFVEVAPDTIDGLLAAIPLVNETGITPEQLADLHAFLKENILAYKTGDGEGILKSVLRADYAVLPPRHGAHNPDQVKIVIDRPPESDLPEDPEARMREKVLRAFGGSGGSGYRNLYNRLSPDKSRITFRRADEMPTALMDELLQGPFVPKKGSVQLVPQVRYENDPEKVLRDTGELLFADIRLAATDMNGEAYSRVKRMYWSPRDSKWLPMEIMLMRDPAHYEFF